MTLQEIADKKLYFRYGRSLMHSVSFWFVDKEQPDPERVVAVRDGDCGEVKEPHLIPRAEFDKLVQTGGLWRRVGLWDFAPADDPAASAIRFCHSSPQAAGRELHRLRERLRRLEWIVQLYDAATVEMWDQWAVWRDRVNDEHFGEFDAACKRVHRIQKWLPGME